MRILLWYVEWAMLESKRGQEAQRIYRDFAPNNTSTKKKK